MAIIPAFLNPIIARKRWMKRAFRGFISEFDSIEIGPKLTIFYSLKDIAGPSFDIGYDRVEAFYNYEKEDKDLILKYLKPDSHFLDIGANIGHFSFYFKDKIPSLHCHLFEPNPKLQHCISSTIDASQLSGIKLHTVALSDSNGTATFYIDSYNDGGHSLIGNKISQKSSYTTSINVETVKLDDYAEKNGIQKIDVIKIDIQGAEAAFIRGALNTLNKFKPVMMIEVDSEKTEEFFNLLKNNLSFDFDFFYYQKREPMSLSDVGALGKELFKKGQKEANFLIVPRNP